MAGSRGARRALLIVGAVVLPVALALTTSAIVRVSDPANAGILPAITTSASSPTDAVSTRPIADPTATASPHGGAPASPEPGGAVHSGGGPSTSPPPTVRPTDDSPNGSGSGGGSDDRRRHGGGDD